MRVGYAGLAALGGIKLNHPDINKPFHTEHHAVPVHLPRLLQDTQTLIAQKGHEKRLGSLILPSFLFTYLSIHCVVYHNNPTTPASHLLSLPNHLLFQMLILALLPLFQPLSSYPSLVPPLSCILHQITLIPIIPPTISTKHNPSL